MSLLASVVRRGNFLVITQNGTGKGTVSQDFLNLLFWTQKTLPGPYMNRLKQFCASFRFCEDIRLQISKFPCPHSQQPRRQIAWRIYIYIVLFWITDVFLYPAYWPYYRIRVWLGQIYLETVTGPGNRARFHTQNGVWPELLLRTKSTLVLTKFPSPSQCTLESSRLYTGSSHRGGSRGVEQGEIRFRTT